MSSTLVYSTEGTEARCEDCGSKAMDTMSHCPCCPEHGRREFRLCTRCRDELYQRFTCWYHGDCC